MNASTIYNFETGKTFDRTKGEHLLGTFDIDFRDRNAPNPQARKWTYGATAKTLVKARKDAEKLRVGLQKQGIGFTVETRVVDAETGTVL